LTEQGALVARLAPTPQGLGERYRQPPLLANEYLLATMALPLSADIAEDFAWTRFQESLIEEASGFYWALKLSWLCT